MSTPYEDRTLSATAALRELVSAVAPVILEALPLRLVPSKEEFKTRVRHAVEERIGRPLSPVEVSPFIRAAEQYVAESRDVLAMKWRPDGSQWCAVVLRDGRETSREVEALLREVVRPAVVPVNRDALGRSYENWVAETLRTAHVNVMRFADVVRGGALGRAADLAVIVETDDGVGFVVMECRDARAETVHFLGSREATYARAFAAAGCVYLLVHPEITSRAAESMNASGGLTVPTDGYVITDPARHARLDAIGVPRPMTLLTPDPPTGASLPLSQATSIREAAEVASEMIPERLRGRDLDEARSLLRGLHSDGEVRRFELGPRRSPPKRVMSPPNSTIVAYEIAVAVHDGKLCVACRTRLWVDGACVMGRCRMHGVSQGTHQLTRPAAAAYAQISETTLWRTLKRHGVTPVWSRGPASVFRSSRLRVPIEGLWDGKPTAAELKDWVYSA